MKTRLKPALSTRRPDAVASPPGRRNPLAALVRRRPEPRADRTPTEIPA